MTKKDGDRLRAMQKELREIASDYQGSTGVLVLEVEKAVNLALKGHSFKVVPK